jgi:hypothetical protein
MLKGNAAFAGMQTASKQDGAREAQTATVTFNRERVVNVE